ncbi:MAG: cytochrome c maturation protein CcmE [Enterobacteriaceae bacterium]
MNQGRRYGRLYLVLGLLAGSALIVTLVLYALRSNIDLFYTPGEIVHGGKQKPKPHIGQRLRIGGMVQPGSVHRDGDSLKVSFALYDAQAVVSVTYQGILPDLFREGQGVVAKGVLQADNHIVASEVLAKHDENYTPPEIAEAMESNHLPQVPQEKP